MRKVVLPVMFLGALLLVRNARAEDSQLTQENLADFLARCEQNFGLLETAYADLANVDVSLRDEQGQSLGRRRIEDRKKNLVEVRETVRKLAKDPQNLVLTTTLFVRNEALSDDLFDLAQIAYDNDIEELGKRFSDLETAFEYNQKLLEAYTLKLATEKQDRMHQLENENQELQRKLKIAESRTREMKGQHN